MIIMIRIILFLVLLGGFCQAQMDKSFFIIGRNTGTKVLENLDTIPTFGFAQMLNENPPIPGPTLIVNEGDSVEIDFWNVSQGAPHTIHLHGLDVDQENDGVPHLSYSVHHMEHGFYRFKAPHPGTYLYHCHVASTIHVQAGMYGMIIVKPASNNNITWENGYTFNDEMTLFMSEIDTSWHTEEVLEHEHDTTVHEIEIPDYDAQFFLVNGFSGQQIIDENIKYTSYTGRTDYFRLANLGYYYNKVTFPESLNAVVVSSDGRPLPSIEETNEVYLFPGERYGVLVSPTSITSDSIFIDYINMNNQSIEGSEAVAVEIGQGNDVSHYSVNTEIKIISSDQQEITVELFNDQAQEIDVQIFDASGKLVHYEKRDAYQGLYRFAINTMSFASGIYYLSISSSNRRVTEKFIR